MINWFKQAKIYAKENENFRFQGEGGKNFRRLTTNQSVGLKYLGIVLTTSNEYKVTLHFKF